MDIPSYNFPFLGTVLRYVLYTDSNRQSTEKRQGKKESKGVQIKIKIKPFLVCDTWYCKNKFYMSLKANYVH